MSNRPSGVVVWAPVRSVSKSMRRPRTRTVSGAPLKALVRWGDPPIGAPSGARRPVIHGARRGAPRRSGSARRSSARRTAISWDVRSGDGAAARSPDRVGRVIRSAPRSAEARAAGAGPARRAKPTPAMTRVPRARPHERRTGGLVLEAVSGREAVHAIEELGLGHVGEVEPEAPVADAKPVGHVLDGPDRVADVPDPKRDQPVEFVLRARVPN